MIKKIIYSLLMIVLVAFITTIKPSFASAAEDDVETGELVIETSIDDNRYDNLDVVYMINKISINDEEGNPYTGKVKYQINDESEEKTFTFIDGVGSIRINGAHNIITLKGISEGYTYKVETIEYSSTKLIIDVTDGEGIIGEGNNIVKVNATIDTYDLEFIMHISGVYDDLEVPVHFHANRYDRYPIPNEGFTYELIRDGKIIDTGKTELTKYELYLLDTMWLKDGDRLIIKDITDFSGVGFVGSLRYNDNRDFGELFLEKYGISFSRLFSTTNIPDSYIFDNQERRVVHLNFVTKYNKLILSKIPSGKGVERDKEFTFKIKGTVPSITKEDLYYNIAGNYPYIKYIYTNDGKKVVDTGTLEFDENGIAYIKLKLGEYVEIGENPKYFDEDGATASSYNIFKAKLIELIDHCFPPNIKFEITELDSEGYDTEIVDMSSHKDYDPFVYKITNTRKFTGKLTINKKVSGNEADKDKEFNFKIKLEDGAADIPMIYSYTGAKDGELEFDENFEATITLKDGESITIEGLPVGAKYTVEEDDYSEEGYTTTVVGGSGTIKEGETVTASFTNHKGVDTIEDVPKTGDNIYSWLILILIALIGITSSIFILKRKYSKV